MPTVTLTELTLRHLALVVGRQVIYLDKNGPTGFGVRVTEKGARSFVLTYGPHRKRVKLGDVGLIPLSKAREKAKNLLAARQLSGEEREPDVMTFEEAVRLFLTVRCAQRNKASTAKETGRLLNRHFLPDLKDKTIQEIATADLVKITDALLGAGTKSEANHAFTAARTLFRWLTKRGYIPHSPLEGAEMPARTVSRDRLLSDAELRQVLTMTPAHGAYGKLVECLVLTAQRDGQLAHLHRDFINPAEKTITWPGRLMKGGQEHTIPYTDWTGRLLDARPEKGLLFPGETNANMPFANWSNCKRRFDKACPMPHWTLHDLRRTFSTHAAALGIAPHITDLVLDHSPIELSGVRSIYNRHRYIEEMREAVSRWEQYLTNILARAADTAIGAPEKPEDLKPAASSREVVHLREDRPRRP